jgi:Tfp pilus assembly protein PilF
VPLICRFPDRFPAGKRETAPVSLVDLYPTLCKLLRVEAPTNTLGRNLVSSLQGGNLTPGSCYAGTDDPFLQNGWSPQRSLTTERWKYVRSTIPELYDLIADPHEANNLAFTNEEQVALMDQKLVEFESRMETREAEEVQLSSRERRALRSLGYLGGGSSGTNSPPGAELPDVKQMLTYDASAQAAIDLLHAGRVQEARTKLQEIVDATPIHAASRVFLGETYADQGDLVSAVKWYEAALKIKPDNADALVHLGTALIAQGRIPDAIARFEEALQIDEESTTARYNLGLALARQGQVENARIHFEKLLQIDDHFPEARVALASALIAEGRYPEAVIRLEQEVKINRRSASARLNLATLLAEQEPTRAYNLLLDALRIDPNNGQAHYNLGAFLLLYRRPAEAIAPLVEAVRIMPENARAASELDRAKRLAGQR